MSVTITSQVPNPANNPQPKGELEAGLIRNVNFQPVVTDLNNIADAVNAISETAGTIKANTIEAYSGSLVTFSNAIALDKANVTQLTSKTTAVPITKRTGTITTVALTDAANASFSFDVTLTGLTSSNVPLLTVDQNGSTGFAVASAKADTNKITITVKNVDASAALNAAIKIHYTIL